MVRFRPFQLTPSAVFVIGAALLPRHVAPKFNPHSAPQVLLHTVAMSSTSTNATSWIQSRLTALYEGTSLQDTFDQAFSPACKVRLDHVVHPLQMFKGDLASRRAAATHVSVAWGADLISTNDDKPGQVRATKVDLWSAPLADTAVCSLLSSLARSSSRARFPFASVWARRRDTRTFTSAPSKHRLDERAIALF